ncbi:lysozyme-like [Cimex lectularius]|uniref:lysozyme n=1 Tax=Cimex lectularius TaxID=79782 RepID=A0A8I6SMD7_CIMLE|nr:lysozyme-like [Cimex lectularius]XP_024085841.1 lysozyme-like [Cimex lectularius]
MYSCYSCRSCHSGIDKIHTMSICDGGEKRNMPANVSDWVCIAEHASKWDSFFGETAHGGLVYNGLFGISNEMCGVRNFCRINCEEVMLADDVAPAFHCAYFIYKKFKFGRWPVWEKECKDKYVLNCS